jgi:hypothetical protein
MIVVAITWPDLGLAYMSLALMAALARRHPLLAMSTHPAPVDRGEIDI